MKSIITLVVLVIAFLMVTKAQNVNIPDANFKVALVADLSINTNGDGEISIAEAIAYHGSIYVANIGISDMTGIEAFPNITYLNCAQNNISNLDVSHNTVLTYLGCYNNHLTSLNVSYNTALQQLYCFSNSISILDVSYNSALRYLTCNNNNLSSLEISHNPALLSLYCGYNQLGTLDVSFNTAMTWLECNNNLLTYLNVSNNTALNELNCGVNSISNLNVSNNPVLHGLTCYSNPLNTLDLSHNTELGNVLCSFNQLTSLDLSNNPILTQLNCADNNLGSIDLTHNTAMQYLYVYDDQLTSLDLSHNTALIEFNCDGNLLGTIDVSLDAALNWFSCRNNPPLSSLNIANGNNHNMPSYGFSAYNNPNLYCIQVDDTAYSNANWSLNIDPQSYFSLSCVCAPIVNIPDANFKAALVGNPAINTNGDGEIQVCEAAAFTGFINVQSLNIADLTGIEAFTALTGLACPWNFLTTIDVSHNTALTYLDLGNNAVHHLDVSQNTSLSTLYCYLTGLTTLDVSHNTALTFLDCASNFLSNLDLSHNNALTKLECQYNALNSIDVSHNLALTTFYCQANTISSIDISQNTAITIFDCNNNSLISLNVADGNNTNFTYFDATNNSNLSCIQVDDTAYSNANWSLNIDAQSYFSLNCACIPPTPVITPNGSTTFCDGGSVNLDAGVYTSYLWNNNSTDEALTVTASGTYFVTVTNSSGCTGTASQDVTVQELPVITCPSDIVLSNDAGLCGAFVDFEATATGNPTPDITYSNVPGIMYPVGTTTVIATATSDNCTATCSFTITIIDNEVPVMTSPTNITVNNDAGNCGAVVCYDLPTVTDNCGGGSQTFNYSGSITNFIVPFGITSLTITANGAQGGEGTGPGGLGASITGTVSITSGQVLKILVGGHGFSGIQGGGGGGSFVTDINNNPLVVAGGGGGGWAYYPVNAENSDGVIGTSGQDGIDNGYLSCQCPAGAGGTNGNGGDVDHHYNNDFEGTGGGGLIGDGVNDGVGPTGGFSFVNGGAGGTGCSSGGNGGFGGGGGADWCYWTGGGGGGGYSGGGGGFYYGVGGGGGSYNSGISQNNISGANSGDGIVIITWDASFIVSLVSGQDPCTVFAVGTTTNTYMATDFSGNTATSSFTVTVYDNEVPVITCPSNITVNNDVGNCSTYVCYNFPTVTDNCAIGTQTFNYSGSFTNFTVPSGVTSLIVTVKGAQGGNGTGGTGGLGSSMTGTLSVTSGQVLNILVGGQGESDYEGGGGGGSFVVDLNNNPLVIAGGGGGGYFSNYSYNSGNNNAVIGNSGQDGMDGGYSRTAGAGGTSGNGGGVEMAFFGYSEGAGGGGLIGNGTTSFVTTGGNSFVNGGAGGIGNIYGGNGGFGGGGGADWGNWAGCGGGGGYSGGGGGSYLGVGGGGGSYNAGSDQNNIAGINTGDGIVIISWNVPVTVTLLSGQDPCTEFAVGTTSNIFIATDMNGNTASCSFTVTVIDNEAPVIGSCPNNISQCGNHIVTFAIPIVSDNCSATVVCSPGSGSVFSTGVTTVVCTAIDDAGLTAMCSFTVTINDNPAPTITPSGPTSFCSDGSVNLDAGVYSSYHWSTGATSQVITATTGGTYIVTVTNANGCTGTTSQVVTVVQNLNVTITGPSSVCNGGQTTLDAGVYTSYAWSTGATNESILVTATGTYSVTVTNSTGCTGSASKVITGGTINVPVINANGPYTFCPGGSLTLSTSGYASYLWSTGETTASITVTTGGNYIVTVTNISGCTSTNHKTVTVYATPLVNILGPNTLCPSGSIVINVGASFPAYNWSTGATTQAITVTTGGTYSVTVTNVNGCTGTQTKVISAPGCPTPVTNGTTNIAARSGIANWTQPACVYNYSIRISKTGLNAWTTYTFAPNSHYTFSGLTANTTYDWQIRMNCDAQQNSVSAWSAITTFTTLAQRIGESDNSELSFNVYPNPADALVTIAFPSMDDGIYNIKLIDMTGRIVRSETDNASSGDNTHIMNLDGIAKGVYTVILQNGDNISKAKLVVE